MRKVVVCLCAAVMVSFCFAQVAQADGFAEENAQLKVRIGKLEAELAAMRRAHPAESQAAEPNPIEEVVEPFLLPSQIVWEGAERVTGGWLDRMQEGLDRVDHFFYVEYTKAWMTTEYQFDTRGFQTLNFTGASRLPAGFNVWGFVDFESADAPANSDADKNEFFMEIDLKREVWKGIGGIVEYNDGQGRNDNVGRVGAFYTPKWPWLKQADLFLYTKWFPLGTEPSRRQGSVAWNWTPHYLLEGRFSTGGFFDLNFDEKEGHRRGQIVSDTQLRYRLIGNVHALVEYRYSEFAAKDNESGWGLGLQYRF